MKHQQASKKKSFENVPDSNSNIMMNIAPNQLPQPQFAQAGTPTFYTTSGQVQQQPPQVLAPQVLHFATQPQFVQAPQIQLYNSAIPQPIFQQIGPQFSSAQPPPSVQAPMMYTNGIQYVVQQPQYIMQQPQVQYPPQNIVTSSYTYNDGGNQPVYHPPKSSK